MRTENLSLILSLLVVAACSTGDPNETTVTPYDPTPEAEEPRVNEPVTEPVTAPQEADPTEVEVATFGAGCFWCVEAVLEQLDGVKDVRSGYMGGHVVDPEYRAVCSGETGHAEVVQVDFDPSVITYEALLGWFWQLHDPTTLNRQDRDVGTQYRSAIFVHSESQRAAAQQSMAAAQGEITSPIVTEITDASEFYVAEEYHQDYYRGNKRQGYCRMVITPKLKKLDLEH